MAKGMREAEGCEAKTTCGATAAVSPKRIYGSRLGVHWPEPHREARERFMEV